MLIKLVLFVAIYEATHDRESQDQLNEETRHKASNARRKKLHVIHFVTRLVYDFLYN